MSSEQITLTEDSDGFWIARHKELNATTQGKSREEALLMLVDLINEDKDLVQLSENVFTID